MATLILEDGKQFRGQPFGYVANSHGEIVFQTGMVGYTETLTDPSYFGQILVMTNPLIGNYGVPDGNIKDDYGLSKYYESNQIWVSALVVSQCTPDGEESHYLSNESLNHWLYRNKIVGIEGIDTRSLTKYLRDKGTTTGKIIIDPEILNASSISMDEMTDYSIPIGKRFQKIKEGENIEYFKSNSDKTLNVLVVDCGIKISQMRYLLSNGMSIKKVSSNYDFTDDVASGDYDALYLSNGPGDPEDYSDLIKNLKKILQSKVNIPIMGVCLGNQVLSLSAGFSTYKMKYGNRGHNQPCIDTICNNCVITSQNHGYAVDLSQDSSDPSQSNMWKMLYQNINDKSTEGIYHTSLPYFAVQFHPEHSAGPRDTEFLFRVFSRLSFAHKMCRQTNSDCSPTFQSVMKEFLTTDQIAMDFPSNIVSWQKLPLNSKYQRRVLILGSGGLCIGQAGEFDYSGSQAIKALKEENIYTILVNPNVATVQTTRGLAESVYLVPVNADCVTQVIELERPDGIILSFGGQTALNCGLELDRLGIFKKYNVTVLGTSIETIKWTEDRKIFSEKMKQIGEPVAPSVTAASLDEALTAANHLCYPVMVRSAYALGGKGSGFAHNAAQLESLVNMALQSTPHVIIDKSLIGWKEIEYEVVRDVYDNCITVCNMENIDPLGIHTGESIVVAPSQTLDNSDFHALRAVATKVVRHLKIIGECNIQYALDPLSRKYYIIEVNARLSRSSALASKATGYPLAYIGAKLALGSMLPNLANAATSGLLDNRKVWTSACFEPSLDYVVIKMPRWDMNKFSKISKRIGTSMKSVGEAMAIGRSFEEALQKSIRMVDVGATGFNGFDLKENDEELSFPSDKRIFYIAAALESGKPVDYIHDLTKIDKWFLHRMSNIIKHTKMAISLVEQNPSFDIHSVNPSFVKKMKQLGFSDIQLADIFLCTSAAIRDYRHKNKITPFVRQIDTVAGEYACTTNYLYLTYVSDEHDIVFNKSQSTNSIIVLGSGVYRIGSSVEFDCCSVSCIKELRQQGWNPIMVNFNPETVSTDYDECHRLYFDEISLEVVLDIYGLENPFGIILSMGGQLPNNIAMDLHRTGVNILGTSPEMIDTAENRFKFSRLIDSIDIKQPDWKELTTFEEAKKFCHEVGYPCLVRPSYVLSGAAMSVASNDTELESYLSDAVTVSKDHPVVITKFILNAKEIDVDAVASNGKIICIAVSEHIENAGTHSGDASLILPPKNLNKKTLEEIYRIAFGISDALNITGPFNLQLLALDNQLKVIECNLRVSRSFPFVSKVLNCNFMAIATKVTLGLKVEPIDIDFSKLNAAVKVPQFSFSQLTEADVRLGVEMASTGEVACFGKNYYEAYLKALVATGFKLPSSKNVFISIGPYKTKLDLVESLRQLINCGYTLYGSKGTVDFYREHDVNIKAGIFSLDDRADSSEVSNRKQFHHQSLLFDVKKFMTEHKIDLIINIPLNYYLKSAGNIATLGYQIRRAAVDYSISLITEKNNAKMFISAITQNKNSIMVDPTIDVLLSGNIVRLPGLIDVHTHMREPGAEHKEDFLSGTTSALMGGITCVLCMPNTNPPVIDYKTLVSVKELASSKAICDYGLYIGATENNADKITSELISQSFGMKMYLNDTYSDLKMSAFGSWVAHFEKWDKNCNVPILCHAEGQTLSAILYLVSVYKKPVHICHVSTKEEIQLIKNAKEIGLPVTCEVTPHHLFICDEDLEEACVVEGRKTVKPPLNTKADRESLWANLKYIDCFASDHAPHLLSEKDSIKPPPGFPGVETMLPLLLTAVKEGKLTIDDIILRLHDNPMKIFNLKEQPETFVDVEFGSQYSIKSVNQHSKAGWTPFEDRIVCAKVLRVFIRGRMAMVAGKILVEPGFGVDAKTWPYHNSLENTVKDASHKNSTPSLILPENNVCDIKSPIQISKTIKESMSLTKTSNLISQSSVGRILNLLKSDFRKNFRNRNFLSTETCTRDGLRFIFSLATEFQKLTESNAYVPQLLEGKVISLAFFESSTRTMLSFQSAIQRLGGSVLPFRPSDSSMSKGETLEDTLKVLSSFTDAIVLRHPQVGTLEMASSLLTIPVINAGDGIGEHPSQALLDCFTIREEKGTVNKLRIAFVGDLKNGRTVHSLAKLLALYKIDELIYVSPPELSMPKEIKDYVRGTSTIKQLEYETLDDIISRCDVIYMTRIQKERFTNLCEYNKYKGCFTIDQKLLTKAKSNMIILHPLPRVDEIHPSVDTDSRAAYFRQVRYGVFVRMALMAAIIADELD